MGTPVLMTFFAKVHEFFQTKRSPGNIFLQVKPCFTNYQPHPSSLGPEVKLKGGGTKIDESKHNIFEKFSKIEKLKILKILTFQR